MGYYIRVLGTDGVRPRLSYLRTRLKDAGATVILSLDAGTEEEWSQLTLSHSNGTEIASIEYNQVVEGELGRDELDEFISEVEACQPASAAQWLGGYLPKVKAIYALQLLSGTEVDDGWAAVHAIQGAIWTKSGGILQSDGEGFTNEDGYHILWQFSDTASGSWKMAVLKDGEWVAFEMNLGDLDQRKDFLAGRVPVSIRLL